jgi:hypothetical protein
MIRRAQIMNKRLSPWQSILTAIQAASLYAAGHPRDVLDVFCYPPQ